MLLSVSKWRRILRVKTETKSAQKTIFSGNGNGLKNFTFLSTREQKNVHTVYVTQECVAERFSASDLCSDGRVVRTWVRILHKILRYK